MLQNLSIRDVVVIKELDVEFRAGMTVLTGETGSGKSILLDALGLALGMRADSALIRKDADKASVTAEFQLPKKHPIFALLAEQSLESDGALILRRVLHADGKSKAFINDQPISIQLLKQIGGYLVEIHGQFDQHGLLNKDTHLASLDRFAGLEDQAVAVRKAYSLWRACEKHWQDAVDQQQDQKSQEEYWRHIVTELRAFDPKPGEEEELSKKRVALQHHEKLQAAFSQALNALEGDDSADKHILTAQKALTRVADKAPESVDPILDALERASIELREVAGKIRHGFDSDADAQAQLETLEDRLFGMRELARKYNVQPDQLGELLQQLEQELQSIETSDTHIQDLFVAMKRMQQDYMAKASALSEARRKAAKKLDQAVAKELEPLKLGKASFVTAISDLAEESWNEKGKDRVEFEVATNPGMPAGPLSKIASGGELSRFMLALKVVLAGSDETATLIFDEIDTGVSGSVADAVGQRLERLGQNAQVLLVTHSPQVSSKAQHHYRIAKQTAKNSTVTTIEILDAKQRREEVARMLSGAEITAEARAAADRLLGAA